MEAGRCWTAIQPGQYRFRIQGKAKGMFKGQTENPSRLKLKKLEAGFNQSRFPLWGHLTGITEKEHAPRGRRITE